MDLQAVRQDTERHAGASFHKLRCEAGAFAERITNPKLKEMYTKCFFNTLDTTVQQVEDGSVYIITGDIDAMWLRDSSAQVMQYLEFAPACPDAKALIKGLSRRQMFYIQCDPYANAFNREANGRGFTKDECQHNPMVWERKFELDSLCYPFFLASRYYDVTQDASIFDGSFLKSAEIALSVFETEQHHAERSSYYHYRPDEAASFSVPNGGRGGAVSETGLIWSGYRPSDDPCVYGYFIPGNMFVSVTLGRLIRILRELTDSAALAGRAERVKTDVDNGLKKYAVVRHPKYGQIFAYETDGLGNYLLMDDANVPSLLSIPYLGYLPETNEIYRNTRRFILGADNPYYFTGSAIAGVGSPHTPENFVWPISLMIQGLTTEDSNEINGLLEALLSSDADTGFMHEGIDCNDASHFTRSWFAWANSLFSYFIMKKRHAIKYFSKE